MNKHILFNPAISTLNKGDDIIVESCKKELNSIIAADDYCVEICSHLPIVNYYLDYIGDVKYTFVLGSNLLGGKMNRKFKQWYLLWKNLNHLKNVVLMGVGWRTYNEKPNLYTRVLLRRILNNGMVHSVRDDYTKHILEMIGIKNVVNTGCPTMWELTKEHCESIPKNKSDSVIFTLTDYRPSPERDKKMIRILLNNYTNVYFWVQGIGDLDYINSIVDCEKENIHFISPNLDSYELFLEQTECDYVGTRLHAGIKALQCCKRTIIIGIDNRAIELEKDYNIVCLNEDKIDELDAMLKASFETTIKINQNKISIWKNQFLKDR